MEKVRRELDSLVFVHALPNRNSQQHLKQTPSQSFSPFRNRRLDEESIRCGKLAAPDVFRLQQTLLDPKFEIAALTSVGNGQLPSIAHLVPFYKSTVMDLPIGLNTS